MVRGFITKSWSATLPQGALQVEFQNEEQVLAQGEAYLGESRIRLHLPMGTDIFQETEQIEFVFSLPVYGLTHIKARVSKIKEDRSQPEPYLDVDVELVALSKDLWNTILDNYPMAPAAKTALPTVQPKSAIPTVQAVHAAMQQTQAAAPAAAKPTHTGNQPKEAIKEFRVPASLQCHLRLSGGQLLGALEDISFGGARVRLGTPVFPNDPVQINLNYGGVNLNLNANCIWSNPVDAIGQSFFAGVRFNELDTEQKAQLRSLIMHLASLPLANPSA